MRCIRNHQVPLYDQISLHVHVCRSHPTVEVNASLKASRSKSQPGQWATNQKRRRVSDHPDHPLSLSLGVWVTVGVPCVCAGKKPRVSDPFSEFLKTLQKPAAKDIVQHLKS